MLKADKSDQDYAVTAIKIINQARREGYEPTLLASVISAIDYSVMSLQDIQRITTIQERAMSLLMDTAIVENAKEDEI
jgi:hypothetical protein